MTTVWLGRGVSNNIGLIETLRAQHYHVVVSHASETWAGQEYASSSFQEPNIGGQAYISWVSETLDRYAFDYFVPGRCLGDFHAFPERLKAKLVMGCSPETSNDLDDKAIFYRQCQEAGFDFVADFACFYDKATFEKAHQSLLNKGHTRFCMKPAKGVFAQGFRILTNKNPLDFLMQINPNMLRTSDLVRWMEERLDYHLNSMILMPLFDGKELSIDGSFDGQDYRLVARLKKGNSEQVILTDQIIYDTGLAIAKQFGLKGIFNIQLMYHQGKAMVLEVNPRPAGGMAISLLSDVELIAPSLFGNAYAPSLLQPTQTQEIVASTHYKFKSEEELFSLSDLQIKISERPPIVYKDDQPKYVL